jgi:hypothetical protein
MAFPTTSETLTTLASYIPTIWGDKINDFFKLKLMLADFFVDRSAEVAAGSNVLYTPATTEMSANAKVNATAVTLNAPTDSKITLAIDQWFEVSFAIEDREAAQMKQSYYLQEKYAMNAGYTMAKKLEIALASLFLNFTGTAGSSTANLADSDILSAIAQLETNGVDTTQDVAFFMAPNVFWKQLQSINKFSLAINTPINDPVAKRPAALLYGIPVYISNNIQNVSNTVGRYNALSHKDALHFATSPLGTGGSLGSSMTGRYGVRVQSSYVPFYLSTVTTADLLYGSITNRTNAGIAVLSAA